MKYLLILSILAFASCATEVKDWDGPDPNGGAYIANDISDPRHYSSDSTSSSRRGMSDDEIMALTKPKKEKRFSGELNFGVGGRF